MKGKRVILGMSGGVDSSVAAALLVEQGYEVLGVTMKVFEGPSGAAKGRCCSLQDVHDARAVADRLNIPYYVFDFVEPFRQSVMENFANEYQAGRTPIPCVHCNREIKFGTLLEKAERLQADYVATGHYVRLEERDGARRMYRGRDHSKDQSYFLFSVTRDQLSKVLFPLGGMLKTEVRAKAADLGLRLASKPESQEICFVPDGNYSGFLEKYRPGIGEPGDMVDTSGKKLAEHRGVPHYTVGQRRGLGLAVGEPLYVISLNPGDNQVVVGSAAELNAGGLVAKNLNWIAEDLEPGQEREVTCRIRSAHSGAAAVVRCSKGSPEQVTVHFQEPQRAVTPGQAAVFYQGEEVLGGGWIESVLEPTAGKSSATGASAD